MVGAPACSKNFSLRLWVPGRASLARDDVRRADGVKAVAAEGGGAPRASLEAGGSPVYFSTVARYGISLRRHARQHQAAFRSGEQHGEVSSARDRSRSGRDRIASSTA